MKKKTILALSMGSIAVLSLVGCNSEVKEIASEDEKKTDTADKVQKETTTEQSSTTDGKDVQADMEVSIEDAIYSNAVDMQEENVEGYLDDIVIADEDIEVTKQALTQLFESIDATYEITKINVLEQTDTTAKVEVTQVTKAVEKTEGFQDNESTTIHTMELVDGKWKFVTSEVKTVNYL